MTGRAPPATVASRAARTASGAAPPGRGGRSGSSPSRWRWWRPRAALAAARDTTAGPAGPADAGRRRGPAPGRHVPAPLRRRAGVRPALIFSTRRPSVGTAPRPRTAPGCGCCCAPADGPPRELRSLPIADRAAVRRVRHRRRRPGLGRVDRRPGRRGPSARCGRSNWRAGDRAAQADRATPATSCSSTRSTTWSSHDGRLQLGGRRRPARSRVTEIRSVPLTGGDGDGAPTSAGAVGAVRAGRGWSARSRRRRGRSSCATSSAGTRGDGATPSATELVTCSPTWCRALVIAGDGPTRIDLMRPDGSDRRPIAGAAVDRAARRRRRARPVRGADPPRRRRDPDQQPGAARCTTSSAGAPDWSPTGVGQVRLPRRHPVVVDRRRRATGLAQPGPARPRLTWRLTWLRLTLSGSRAERVGPALQQLVQRLLDRLAHLVGEVEDDHRVVGVVGQVRVSGSAGRTRSATCSAAAPGPAGPSHGNVGVTGKYGTPSSRASGLMSASIG